MKSKSVSKKLTPSDQQIDDLLADLLDRYQDTVEQHQWPWETERWYELVYCLFSAVEGQFGPDTNSASAVVVLIELGLLNIPVLAKADKTTSLHISIVLERISFSHTQAEKLVKALCDLAKCFQEMYQGKVQLLLRQFGMELVDRILQTLPLKDTLGKQNASLVVMHWLQNVLNLPVLVPSPGLRALLAETGVKSEDVLAITDELNLNIALLDEILNRWVSAYPQNRTAR